MTKKTPLPTEFSLRMLSKLGSICVHAKEYTDDEVVEFLGALSEHGLLPIARS